MKELITKIKPYAPFIGSVIRHALNGAGAAMVTHGAMSEVDEKTVVAGAMILVSVVWGQIQKRAKK